MTGGLDRWTEGVSLLKLALSEPPSNSFNEFRKGLWANLIRKSAFQAVPEAPVEGIIESGVVPGTVCSRSTEVYNVIDY